MNILLYRLRRMLLRTLVPEFVWPSSVMIDGASIRVRSAPYSFGVKLALTLGEYESEERQLLSPLLHPGDVVVEMGGSIGILTAIIASKVGAEGFVVSVEASATLAEYSTTWLEADRNVKVVVGFGFPVWELQQSLAIEKFEQRWGSMSGRLTFSTGSSVKSSAADERRYSLYDLKRLSAFATRPPVTLVVDIEGSERILCSQKPEFPASLKTLVIELHPEIYGDFVKNQVIRSIQAEGFALLANHENVFHFGRPATT